MSITITKVNIYPVTSGGKVKAMASITLDSEFVVNGFKVIEGTNGVFVSNPSERRNTGEYKDTSFPITKDFREYLNRTILEAYKSHDGITNLTSVESPENLFNGNDPF